MEPASFAVTKLFRDSLRLCDYVASRTGIANHKAALRKEVRTSFKKHMHETDPAKIEEHKEAAVRGLSNYMFHEAQRMSKENQANGDANITV